MNLNKSLLEIEKDLRENREIFDHLVQGYRIYCDGKEHRIYTSCMKTWQLSEIIPCLCSRNP